MARIEKRKKSKAEVQGSYFILKVIRFSRLEMSNSGPNLQEYRKKGLLEKDISFLSLSPLFFFCLFHVRTQAKTRGKSKLGTVLKIKRYEQSQTQEYSVYGGSG